MVIWGTAETSVTIIAASIPVLRVLFLEVKKTARVRYGTDDTGAVPSKVGRSFVTVTVNAEASEEGDRGGSGHQKDDRSDRRILERAGNGTIVQINEFRVESYRNSEDNSDASMGYEMHAV